MLRSRRSAGPELTNCLGFRGLGFWYMGFWDGPRDLRFRDSRV